VKGIDKEFEHGKLTLYPRKKMSEYTTKAASQITGVSTRNILSYLQKGTIRAEFGPSEPQSGKPYKLSRRNLIEIGMIRIFREVHNFDLWVIQGILEYIIYGQGAGSFEDFYTSPRWGKTVELLLLLEYEQPFKELDKMVAVVVKRDEKGELDFSGWFIDRLRILTERGSSTLVITLGSMKNEVVKRFKI
jgi:hypothetical protein